LLSQLQRDSLRSSTFCPPNLRLAEPKLEERRLVEVQGKTLNRNPRAGLAGGGAQTKMVEPGGIEPPTSCMPCKRSTN
jgi:hypothetical protein